MGMALLASILNCIAIFLTKLALRLLEDAGCGVGRGDGGTQLKSDTKTDVGADKPVSGGGRRTATEGTKSAETEMLPIGPIKRGRP